MAQQFSYHSILLQQSNSEVSDINNISLYSTIYLLNCGKMPDPAVKTSSSLPVIYSNMSVQLEQLCLVTADITLMWLELTTA